MLFPEYSMVKSKRRFSSGASDWANSVDVPPKRMSKVVAFFMSIALFYWFVFMMHSCLPCWLASILIPMAN